MTHFFFFICIVVGFSRFRERSLFSLSFFMIGFFAVFRYGYGNDYFSYQSSYELIQNGADNPFEHEMLFYLLNRILPSFYLLVAVLSVFFLWIVYRLIRDQLSGHYKSLALLIFLINPYLFLMNLSAMRQCAAACFFIISVKYAQERKFLPYVILTGVAALFHTSALLLIPLYFIANQRPAKWIHMAINILVVAVLLLDGRILDRMVRLALEFFRDPNYNYLYAHAATNSLRATILTGITFAYVAINLRYLRGYKLICGKLYLLGLTFGVLAYRFAMFTRLQMYFDLFSVIVIPSILCYHAGCREGKWQKLINLYVFPGLIFIVYLLRYYSFFSNPMWMRFGTYHTIFEALL